MLFSLLVPLDTILPEICAFIIGFSCTVWTKMRPLAGSIADVVLADAILIPFPPPNIRKVGGRQTGTETKDVCQCLMLHPSLPQEQAAKTKMPAVVKITKRSI